LRENPTNNTTMDDDKCDVIKNLNEEIIRVARTMEHFQNGVKKEIACVNGTIKALNQNIEYKHAACMSRLNTQGKLQDSIT